MIETVSSRLSPGAGRLSPGAGRLASLDGDRSDSLSGISSALLSSESRQMTMVMEKMEDKQSKARDMGKMLGAIVIPLVALTSISILSVTTTFSHLENAYSAQGAIERDKRMTATILALQVERDLTATYVSGNRTEVTIEDQLHLSRNASTEAFVEMETFLQINVSGITHRSKRRLLADLNAFRLLVDLKSAKIPIIQPIEFYTTIIHQLLFQSLEESTDLKEGTLWPRLVSKDSLLLLSDLYGIQRAIGSSFFASCSFQDENIVWFRKLYASSEAQWQTIFSYSPKAGVAHQELEDSKGKNGIYLDRMREEIILGKNPCVEHGEAEATKLSAYWFNNMTIFIGIMVDVFRAESRNVSLEVEQVIQHAVQDVSVKVAGLVLTVIASLIHGGVQFARYSRLLKQFGHHTGDLSQKTYELRKTKRTLDRFLYQMVPRRVAEQLKQKKDLIAEEFACVTIYFSTIVEFTSLCHRSTPMQVVKLLNELYSTFDNCIERYDVYKVETIGDAYMVASGVPMPTDRHAYEIACMALDLLQEVKAYHIPHLQYEKLSLRVGLHSGPCVAGVAGNKMPRYCLFGDTVNTASRMESTSKAQRIQVSAATRDQLHVKNQDHKRNFIIVSRGSTVVKGKGSMRTYWLSEDPRTVGSTSNN